MMIDPPPRGGMWLYRLLSWTSPAWPIGAFAYSGGLEFAHEAGWLNDCVAVEIWLRESLTQGALRNEALLFGHGWLAAQRDEPAAALAALGEVALAMQAGAERTLETVAQGAAFRRIALAANETDYPVESANYRALLAAIDDAALPYPIAAAALFACFDIPLREGLTAFLHAAVSNLLSAAQRIVPLGHTDAQTLLVRLAGDVEQARLHALACRDTPPELCLSSSTLAADIAAMRHETQYTRLFRT